MKTVTNTTLPGAMKGVQYYLELLKRYAFGELDGLQLRSGPPLGEHRQEAPPPEATLGAGRELPKEPLDHIELVERAGIAELITCDVLPIHATSSGQFVDRRPYEKLGIVFGDFVPDDPLFVFATLPPTLKKIPEPHGASRTVWIVDDKGNQVAWIFYKASPHDRKAYMVLSRNPPAEVTKKPRKPRKQLS